MSANHNPSFPYTEQDTEQLKFLTLGDGQRLGYKLLRQSGTAPVLVMLHGLASNHSRWSEFVANTRLRQDWHLLRPDLRGHGHSMTRNSYHREQWCADLAAILQAEGLGSAVIAGHSLGAQIGLEFALRYPQQTGGLILIDPVFPELLHGMLGHARRLRIPLWPLNQLLRLFGRLFGKRSFPIRDLYALDVQTREVLKQTSPSEIARLYTNPRVDLEFMPVANYMQDVLQLVRPLPDYSSITRPVRVLLSLGTSLSNSVAIEQKIRRLPQAEIVPIHCNHWPLTEKPDEVREAIEQACYAWAQESSLLGDSTPE